MIIEEIEHSFGRQIFAYPERVVEVFGRSCSTIPLSYKFDSGLRHQGSVAIGQLYTPEEIGMDEKQIELILEWMKDHIYPRPDALEVVGVLFTSY